MPMKKRGGGGLPETEEIFGYRQEPLFTCLLTRCETLLILHKLGNGLVLGVMGWEYHW